MDITERTANDIKILDLEGRLTIGDGAELLRDKVASIAFQGYTKIILNLAGVPYMDSGGLGQLVSVLDGQRRKANRLVKLSRGSPADISRSVDHLRSWPNVFDSVRRPRRKRQREFRLEPEQITDLQEEPVGVRAAGLSRVLIQIRERVAVSGEQHRARRRLIREQPVGAERFARTPPTARS